MNLIQWFKNLFSKAIRAFKGLINAAIPLLRQIIIGQLAEFARDTVTELSVTNLSNEEKRKQAFQRIKQFSITHGIVARDSIINVIIELAVLTIKNSLGDD